MGRARETMDAITAAVTAGDAEAITAQYAPDAVADTPDAGRIEGRSGIVEYLMTFAEAFSDMSFEPLEKLDVGDIAVDEGVLAGRHTGTLHSPDGDIAPTGKTVRLRSCDVVTVRDGVAASHRFYFDQVEFLTQLGLLAGRPLADALPTQPVDPADARVSQRS